MHATERDVQVQIASVTAAIEAEGWRGTHIEWSDLVADITCRAASSATDDQTGAM